MFHDSLETAEACWTRSRKGYTFETPILALDCVKVATSSVKKMSRADGVNRSGLRGNCSDTNCESKLLLQGFDSAWP
ncbi:MAG: hypothetical protein DWH78_11640 [Planctomycetota bacterium]|nr:MAG: hypothetical protein DWH78_11640 [Planctomycetota bacterium]